MANKLLTEDLLSLAEAAKRLPAYRGSGRCCGSTIFRWIHDGVRLPDGSMLRLEGVRLAGRWLTSSEAIARFVDAQTEARRAKARPAVPVRTPGQRQRASERAARQLEKAGI